MPDARPEAGELARPSIRSCSEGDQVVGQDNRDALTLTTALGDLCTFLAKSQNNVLVGHNIQAFDRRVIFNALSDCDMLERFSGLVKGKPLFLLYHDQFSCVLTDVCFHWKSKTRVLAFWEWFKIINVSKVNVRSRNLTAGKNPTGFGKGKLLQVAA